MKETVDPRYTSKRSWRSLWQQYRIYTDRLDLPSFLRTRVIPFDDIVNIEVRPPLVVGDLFRGKSLRYCWVLKLDMADLCRHVALHRKSGIMKRLRFSPDDPEEFVRECMVAMNARNMR